MTTDKRPLSSPVFIIAAACLLLTAVLPNYFKTLFVADSGHMMRFLPLGVALLLVWGLWLGMAVVQLIVILFNIICAIVLWFMAVGVGFDDTKVFSYLLLLVMQLVCIAALSGRQLGRLLSGSPGPAD